MSRRLKTLDIDAINRAGENDFQDAFQALDGLINSLNQQWTQEDSQTLKAMETLIDQSAQYTTANEYGQAVQVLDQLNNSLNKQVSKGIGTVYRNALNNSQEAMQANDAIVNSLQEANNAINLLAKKGNAYTTEEVQGILKILEEQTAQYLPNAQANIAKATINAKNHLTGLIELSNNLLEYDEDDETPGSQVWNNKFNKAQDYMLLGEVDKAYTAYQQGVDEMQDQNWKIWGDNLKNKSQEFAKDYKAFSKKSDSFEDMELNDFSGMDNKLYYKNISTHSADISTNINKILEDADIDFKAWDDAYSSGTSVADTGALYAQITSEMEAYNKSKTSSNKLTWENTEGMMEFIDDRIDFKGTNAGFNDEGNRAKLFIQNMQMFKTLLSAQRTYGYQSRTGTAGIGTIRGL